jgi:SAM-dependent methyltransferase
MKVTLKAFLPGWARKNRGEPIDLGTSLRAAQDAILNRLQGREVRIYEAGGGSMSYLPESFTAPADVTVVDIDAVQLENNTYAKTKILGDIQSHSFPPDSFDLVVCYNVIEHLEAPDRAIRLFHRALRPGGLLFIGAPNPDSLPGLVTRSTPHAMHVWYYKAILGQEKAGRPGEPPFPTFYHKIVKPVELVSFCRALGYGLVYMRKYQSPREREMLQSQPIFGFLLRTVTGMLDVLALGRRDFRYGDYHVVFEKRSATG